MKEKFLSDYLSDHLLETDRNIKRMYLDKAVIKKRRDFYTVTIAKMTNSKNVLCVVEIIFKPKEKVKYDIVLRKKSIVRKSIKFTDTTGYIRNNDLVYYTINNKQLDKVREILSKAEITEKSFEEFINFNSSVSTVNKFKL